MEIYLIFCGGWVDCGDLLDFFVREGKFNCIDVQLFFIIV